MVPLYPKSNYYIIPENAISIMLPECKITLVDQQEHNIQMNPNARIIHSFSPITTISNRPG